MSNSTINSAIYDGWVRHRRYSSDADKTKLHEFNYQVFMVYLDLEELDQVFSQSLSWSWKKPAFAWFRRQDFFDGNPDSSLSESVKAFVFQKTGRTISGSVRLLTNLRYFGYIINPISCYYCFNNDGKLECIVAEVTNTPWGERCHYIIECDNTNDDKQSQKLSKQMHVSPFQPMSLKYQWRSTKPEENLLIHMDLQDASSEDETPTFDATLNLSRRPMTGKNMNYYLWRYPYMTFKVVWGIYWQALKLWIKKIPIYDHPNKRVTTNKVVNKKKSLSRLETIHNDRS